MKAWQSRWMRFVLLVALAIGILILKVSGSILEQDMDPVKLAPFYQKDAFLVAVVRDDVDVRRDLDLAIRFSAEKFAPIEDVKYFIPLFDVAIKISKDDIIMAPGPFFCHDGRYTKTDIVRRAKKLSEVFEFIEVIKRAQPKICVSSAKYSKRLI